MHAVSGEEGAQQLSVQLPPSEAVDFERVLVEEFEAIAKSVANVDSRRAKCFTPADEAMIHEAIESRLSGGHRALDAKLAEALRGWLADEGRAALARLPEAERATSSLINQVGLLLQDQGDLAGAAPLLREALAGRRATLGDQHPSTLISISNLGSLLKAQGDLAGAAPLYREALAGHRATLGDQHPDTLTSIYNLGVLLQVQGDLEAAVPLFREELEACATRHGVAHEETQGSANNLVEVLLEIGMESEAQLVREQYFIVEGV